MKQNLPEMLSLPQNLPQSLPGLQDGYVIAVLPASALQQAVAPAPAPLAGAPFASQPQKRPVEDHDQSPVARDEGLGWGWA